MNGAQDMGGMMGFGPVNAEADEPVFHAAWEGRVLAMEVAIRSGGVPWNLDTIRRVREALPPPRYLNMSYYEIWLHSQEELLTAHGYVSAEELAVGHSLDGPKHKPRVLRPADVPAAVTRPVTYERKPQVPAAFAVGDRVRTRNMNPTGHTRLPRYARGKTGMVERVNGAQVFPDSNAHGRGEDPQWCYNVRIAGPELWGPGSDPTLSVNLDLFEPYLERT